VIHRCVTQNRNGKRREFRNFVNGIDKLTKWLPNSPQFSDQWGIPMMKPDLLINCSAVSDNNQSACHNPKFIRSMPLSPWLLSFINGRLTSYIGIGVFCRCCLTSIIEDKEDCRVDVDDNDDGNDEEDEGEWSGRNGCNDDDDDDELEARDDRDTGVGTTEGSALTNRQIKKKYRTEKLNK
jgi:hypothetical protein